MTRNTKHLMLGLSVLAISAGLGIQAHHARGGFVSSALVGVLDTSVASSQITVMFRAVDQSGALVWEADPAGIQATVTSGEIEYSADVPGEVSSRTDVEIVMWIYAVRARAPVTTDSFWLRGRDGGVTAAATVNPRDVQGRATELVVTRY